MVWTEIPHEKFCVVHCRGCEIPVPIGDVSELEARALLEWLEERRAWREATTQFREQTRRIEKNLRERRQARDRLRDAGYSEDEIPL